MAGDRITTPWQAGAIIVFGVALFITGVFALGEDHFIFEDRVGNKHTIRGGYVQLYASGHLIAGTSLAIAGAVAMRRELRRRRNAD